MEDVMLPVFRTQLLDRRAKLELASVLGASPDISRLLDEVDAALARIDGGTFGACESCGEPIEADRLLADPLTRFCLDHLSPAEQRALQQDLELASRIQRGLLPKRDARFDGWQVAYHYWPAGPVSGDYCDLIPGEAGQVYLFVGDVVGKGVAAAMLMSHLSATLRTLVSVGLPLTELMERASRVFCESTLPTHYATLVCGCLCPNGEVEVCNAGHPPPLVLGPGRQIRLEAKALPIGMFCEGRFSTETVRLAPGDTLFLYTDGLIEAEDATGADFGVERVVRSAAAAAGLAPAEMVDGCLRDLAAFRGVAASADDLTVMAVRRV